MYEYEGKKLQRHELLILTGLLISVRDIKQIKNFPEFVTRFIQAADDPLTVEVRRKAISRKEALLPVVQKVWHGYVHRDQPRGLEAEGRMGSQQSIIPQAREFIQVF